jgi:endonuclease YncB( thermonuclease family)
MTTGRATAALAAALCAAVLAACGAPATSGGGHVDTTGSVVEFPRDPAVVTRWIDGDTLDTTLGRVRVLGMDTPERGRCGFDEATQLAMQLAPVGSAAELVAAGPTKDDKDKYGRLLRYVYVGSTDVGYELIASGLAIARYDSRDGYGWHPREAAYIAADASADSPIC